MILPVRNREATLAALVVQVVEVLPELTPRWELLIVDDGSTDATTEVIQELIRPYPQAAVIHNSAERGDTACFRAGMQRTRSDVLLLRSDSCDLDLAGLDKMWKKISSHDLIVARAHGDAAPGRQPAPSLRKQMSKAVVGPALQMIRRRAIESWITGRSPQDLQSYLALKGYPQHEVELRHASWSKGARGKAAASALKNKVATSPQHRDEGDTAGRPKRPNYLLRLKTFALGE
jgi:hypothetical protein